MESLTLHLLVVLATILVMTYYRLNVWLWIILVSSILAGAHYVSLFFNREVGILWVFIGFVCYVLYIPWLRIRFITYPIFQNLKKMMPPISNTEQEAIEAGDIWKEAEIFQGKINWASFWKFPKTQMTDEEQMFLANQLETLCGMLDEYEIEQAQDLSQPVWSYLKSEKFFGMIIPKEYGGLGFSALANSNVVMKIATRSLAAAVTTMVPNSLGPAELLLAFGTQEQKQQYLPKLATGEEIPCFALTNPHAGSDASSIPDTGIVCKRMFQGKETVGISLTWEKRYITLAPIATLLGLAVQLKDPERLLGGEKEVGITLCLIPTNYPGVEIGQRHNPMNHAFMNGPTRGKDVFVPVEWIIGGASMAGKGWRMLMSCLSAGRGISLPALSVAVGKVCYRTTGAYARVRRQFNLPIGRFEGVESILAEIGGYTYMLEATRLLTLSALDQGKKPTVITGIAKYIMTEFARKITQGAMDLHAGRSLIIGPRNYLYPIYRGVPISITVEGSNVLMRNLVIFGQGILRCHPYIQQEIALLTAKNLPENEQKEILSEFDVLLNTHFRYWFKNYTKGVLAGLTGSLTIAKPLVGEIGEYAREITRMSYALSVVSDIVLLVLGGHLKRAERLSARLADVVIHLYVGMAVLKYYQDLGNDKKDLPHVKWSLEYCLYQCQEAFFGFYQNFPNRFFAHFLRLSLFPFGRVYAPPQDALSPQIASLMMFPSAFRDRLTNYCYLNFSPDNPIGRLENALEKVIRVWPILVKIEKGVKEGTVDKKADILTKAKMALADHLIEETELEALIEAEAARTDAITVDHTNPQQGQSFQPTHTPERGPSWV